MTAADILDKAAGTFRERNAVYKDNWKDVGAVLSALFPDGITLNTPEDHTRFHFVMLMVVKLSRYANCWATGHDDSLLDGAVYNAMLEAFDKEVFNARLAAVYLDTCSRCDLLTMTPWSRSVSARYCSNCRFMEANPANHDHL